MLSIRKIGVIGRTYRNLNRYRKILAVLFTYGFGDLVDRLRIDQYIEIGLQVVSRGRPERVERLTRAERVRLIFEELGPTFVKLGQILSTRPDLIPPDFIQELARLQDNVPPFPFEAAGKIIQKEFDRELHALFSEFDETPIASASIGQVHRAVLASGEEVAVKVQRPGIREIIEVDLEIMLHLATLMEHNIEEIALHRPVRIVEEFAGTLEREIDYALEASSMERVAREFMGDSTVYIPRVFHDATSRRVLTMEYVRGTKVSEKEKLLALGMDLSLITARGAEFVLKQVFRNGFFHADLHPGNMLVLPGSVLCFLDFGMVGMVDRETADLFIEFMDSVVKEDAEKAAALLLELTEYETPPDERRLRTDLYNFMSRHLYKTLKNISVGKLLEDVIGITFRHGLTLPADRFLMMKAFATVEGVALSLDPDFDMVAHAAPFVMRIKAARFSPSRIADDLFKVSADSMRFAKLFPREVLGITREVREGRISLGVEIKGDEKKLATYDQIGNRIAFSVVIAALIMGSALITISGVPPLFYGISLIGIVGFVGAAIMGIWLLIAILKKGRL